MLLLDRIVNIVEEDIAKLEVASKKSALSLEDTRKVDLYGRFLLQKQKEDRESIKSEAFSQKSEEELLILAKEAMKVLEADTTPKPKKTSKKKVINGSQAIQDPPSNEK